MVTRGQQAPLSFMEPITDWVAPDLSDLPSWQGARRVSIDTETKDLDLPRLGPGVRRPGNYLCGYSFAIEDGPQFYVPVRHAGGGNVDARQALAYLRTQAASFTGDVCGAQLQYDLDWLAEEGVEFPQARFFRDTQVAAPLLNELELSYGLDAIAHRAGIPGKDESVLLEALAAYGFRPPHAKRGIYALPARYAGSYGEHDARLPLQLLARQEVELEAQGLWQVYDLESRVLPILVAMRRRGVRVSLDRLEQVNVWARNRQTDLVGEASRLAGYQLHHTEVTKPEALAQLLRHLGVEPPTTAKSKKPSVTNELLGALDHPAGKMLVAAREMATLRSMFCEGIKDHLVINSLTGEARVHCTFNQLRRSKDDDDDTGDTKGAAYGRLSCENPNLQQQPNPEKKVEYGAMWRSIYLPDPGLIWATKDYSQQEPRMAVHYAVKAGEAGLLSRQAYEAALAAQARYRSDPNTDFHDMMTRMVYGEDLLERVGKTQFKVVRRDCKEIYLGLSYGMGGPKLCRKLGLSTQVIEDERGRRREVAGAEGQALIDKFNHKVPFIKQTAWVAQNRARELGYIVTLSGRRCRFPRDEHGNFDWTQKAFNRLVQGASADQTKMALVALEEAGVKCQIQVHDEIDEGEPTLEAAQEAARIMEECCPELSVPSRVDIETGNSWGGAA